MKNNDKASIREVYILTSKLEEKIDSISNRISNLEGKITIISILWSSLVSMGGIIFSFFVKK